MDRRKGLAGVLLLVVLAGCMDGPAARDDVTLDVEEVSPERSAPEERSVNLTRADVSRFPERVRWVWEAAFSAGAGSGVITRDDIAGMSAVLDPIVRAQGAEGAGYYNVEGRVFRMSMASP